MEVKQVAALPKQLAVMDIEMSDEVLTISAVSTQAYPCCPLCGKPSARILYLEVIFGHITDQYSDRAYS